MNTYTKLPWNTAALPKTKKRTSRSSVKPPRFSILFPVKFAGFNIGILHGSHMIKTTFHLGAVTKVHVPYGSVLLFHSDLYHFGDCTLIDGGKCTTSARGFSYVVEEGFPDEGEAKTFHLQDKETCSDLKCNKCEQLSNTLMKYSGQNDGIWRPYLATNNNTGVGTVINGDMKSLGWAILHVGIPDPTFNNKLQDELGVVFNKMWEDIIQTTHSMRRMKTKHLESKKPEFLSPDYEVHGKRMLYGKPYMTFEQDSVLELLFLRNFKVVQDYIKDDVYKGENYTMHNPNLIRNVKWVYEQHIHTDYERSRP